jgi:hypothetical protein
MDAAVGKRMTRSERFILYVTCGLAVGTYFAMMYSWGNLNVFFERGMMQPAVPSASPHPGATDSKQILEKPTHDVVEEVPRSKPAAHEN